MHLAHRTTEIELRQSLYEELLHEEAGTVAARQDAPELDRPVSILWKELEEVVSRQTFGERVTGWIESASSGARLLVLLGLYLVPISIVLSLTLSWDSFPLSSRLAWIALTLACLCLAWIGTAIVLKGRQTRGRDQARAATPDRHGE